MCEIYEKVSGSEVIYDEKTDTLSVILKENSGVAESDEEKNGIILDYDEQGHLVSIEILDASKHVSKPRGIAYEMSE